jgi:hypothetical protein
MPDRFLSNQTGIPPALPGRQSNFENSGSIPRLLLWICRNSSSNEPRAVAVAFAFHRLRSGPFEGSATESLRLCRRVLTCLNPGVWIAVHHTRTGCRRRRHPRRSGWRSLSQREQGSPEPAAAVDPCCGACGKLHKGIELTRDSALPQGRRRQRANVQMAKVIGRSTLAPYLQGVPISGHAFFLVPEPM